MRLKSVIFSLLLVLIYSCVSKPIVSQVTVNNRSIKVNNQPYLIKGICYHPVPKGSENRSFNSIDTDLALMNEAGINTIRVYAPIDNEEVLNKIDKAGIKVIMGFGYNQNGNFDILSGSFINYIKKYKNHNAILFWELGNEYNYHPEWFEGNINNWYTALNNAAELIHKTDSKPVATAHGELPSKEIIEKLPNIDVWGLNVYRWDNPESIFKQWETLSNKPMYLSEAGADSYMTIEKNNYQKGINEKAQADATNNILKSTFNNTDVCLGVTVFSFVDGWWKAGNPSTQDPGGWAPNSSGVPYDGSPNEEYWGILTIDREKKMAFDVVKEHYTNQKAKKIK
ncbi:MAG TPA: glycoside hydrolase family 2 TIM barrel-domain containing protein [Flavobacteriaceae bacterium]|nr:glycoside hydrolase family 2 TIM barrel-domain containing protein [Flavobacteriaceae bacterium]